jgi:hypothetical protein
LNATSNELRWQGTNQSFYLAISETIKAAFKSMKVLKSGKGQMGESAAKVSLFKVKTFSHFKCRQLLNQLKFWTREKDE